MSDVLSKAEALLTEAYAGPNAVADPALIAMLMDLGVSLVKKCLESRNPTSVVEQAKGKTVLARFAVRRLVAQRLREDYGFGGFLLHNGPRVMEALLEAGGKADPQDLERLIEEVE